jgi:hypothetical protein
MVTSACQLLTVPGNRYVFGFIQRQYSRSVSSSLVWPSECLNEEKTPSRGTTFYSPRRQLAVAKQVNLVLANVFWAEAIGRTVEVLREILHGVDMSTGGVLSVVATLTLIHHQLPATGHNNLLVTPNNNAEDDSR